MTNWPQALHHLERKQSGEETRRSLDRLAVTGSLYVPKPPPRESLFLLAISLTAGMIAVLAVVLLIAAIISPEALVR